MPRAGPAVPRRRARPRSALSSLPSPHSARGAARGHGIRTLQYLSSLITAVQGKVAGFIARISPIAGHCCLNSLFQPQQGSCCGITIAVLLNFFFFFFFEGTKWVPACPSIVPPGPCRRLPPRPALPAASNSVRQHRAAMRESWAARRGAVLSFVPDISKIKSEQKAGPEERAVGDRHPREPAVPDAVPATCGCSYHVGSEGGGGGGGRVGAVLEVGVVTRGRGGKGGRSGIRGKSGARRRSPKFIGPGSGDHAGAVCRARVESQGR